MSPGSEGSPGVVLGELQEGRGRVGDQTPRPGASTDSRRHPTLLGEPGTRVPQAILRSAVGPLGLNVSFSTDAGKFWAQDTASWHPRSHSPPPFLLAGKARFCWVFPISLPMIVGKVADFSPASKILHSGNTHCSNHRWGVEWLLGALGKCFLPLQKAQEKMVSSKEKKKKKMTSSSTKHGCTYCDS